MLNLQTVVEELGAKCRGKVWVIVTSQEDIDSVTHVKGNDFSKIQGRFNTRLSLSSASVDEVIKRRILAKNETAERLLRLVYQQNISIMRNLFSFAPGTIADLKGYSSEDEFVESYPFVPYQFKLLQEVLVQVRKHGSSGKHLSGGERSMLSAFQEAAQQVKLQDENCFVPFYCLYDTVHTFLDGAVRRVIDRADRAAQAGDGLKKQDVNVLKLLFLIRYVEGLASSIENLSTLMVDNIHADKITIRRALQESLDRLVHENYVSRSGETYLFLTDEEQDVNREIRSSVVDQNDVLRMIGQAVFSDLYPGKKYRYKNRYDFSYDPMIDFAPLGQPSGSIKLNLITLASGLQDTEADRQRLLLQSSADHAAIVQLDASCDYYQEFEEVRRIEQYVKQHNVSQLSESLRKIVQGKQNEAKKREKTATDLLKEAIVKGSFYIAGERAAIRCSSVKEALDAALSRLVEGVYSKLDYVDTFVQSDQDIQAILTGGLVQESLAGVAQPNDRALAEMQQYLESRSRQHITVTMADMHKRYQGAPYGWREIDIAALTAALMRRQKIQLLYGGAVLTAGDRKVLDCLRKRAETEKTVLRQKVSAPDILIKKARQLAAELFDAMDLHTDEDGLCGQLASLLGDKKAANQALLSRYTGKAPYPGKSVAEGGRDTLEGILTQRSDNIAFLEAFTNAEDALLDWSEDMPEVAFFFENQKDLFDSAWQLCEQVQGDKTYFENEAGALAAVRAMLDILHSPKPYRRIVELPALEKTVQDTYQRINDDRRESVKAAVSQARGDIHTLAADRPELREEIRRADEELDRRAQAALAAGSPTLLDASITQIITYGNSVCKKLEALIAAKDTSGSPRLRVATLRRYDVLPQKRLSSPQEVDAYVADLRQKLLDALQGNDAIQMN